jgi:hypothetical protein
LLNYDCRSGIKIWFKKSISLRSFGYKGIE